MMKISIIPLFSASLTKDLQIIELSRPQKIVNPIQDNKIIKRIAGLNQKL